MVAIREYILGIAAAAVICAVTLSLTGKSSFLPLMKLICGLALTFSIFSPILKISLGKWEDLGIDFREQASEAVREGAGQAEKTVRTLITEETEAYILDKAQALHLKIRVAVQLNENPLPAPQSVTITGTVPPYAKAQLSRMLAEELGIPKEKQQWIS